MSTKKRFAISADLASGIRSSIRSAATNPGQLHYDMMSIEVIEQDPQNPRQLAITLQDLKQGLKQTDKAYAVKVKELEALQELAESIKQVGIRNAIEVYKEGQKYRIISGARRYLATILAGYDYVPVRINQKPDEFKLRYTQWVENINRQDLSLWEKYHNLQTIAEAYHKEHHTPLTELSLRQLLGISAVQAYRYYCLLNADTAIVDLLKVGKINNLKMIQELVSMKDKHARNQVINYLKSAPEETSSLKNYKKSLPKKSSASGTIVLGQMQQVHLIKYLVDVLMHHASLNHYSNDFAKIDWHSAKAVNKAFKQFLTRLSKEIKAEEELV